MYLSLINYVCCFLTGVIVCMLPFTGDCMCAAFTDVFVRLQIQIDGNNIIKSFHSFSRYFSFEIF